MRGTLAPTLTRWSARIDGMSLRERVLIWVTALALLYMAFDQLVYSPIRAAQTAQRAEIAAEQGRLTALETQIRELEAASQRDVDDMNRARLAELKAELERSGPETQALTRQLVTPEAMPRLIEDMLARSPALEVVGLRNLPPVAVTEDGVLEDTPPETADDGGMLFRHGVRVQLRGRYFDLSRYLADLERLPARLLWKHVELRTDEYPVSLLTLEVYTLSLDRALIRI